MTLDTISLAQLNISQLQLLVTGLAIFLGPLSGVLFALWFQARKDKRSAKLDLFLLLMSRRKEPLISKETAQALNKIDVVFEDSPQVKALWHDYYTMLHQPPGEPRVHKWLELLGAMAKDLKYTSITQLDLDKFYIPQGHVDDAEFQRHAMQEWVRVLENTEHFLAKSKDIPPAT